MIVSQMFMKCHQSCLFTVIQMIVAIIIISPYLLKSNDYERPSLNIDYIFI